MDGNSAGWARVRLALQEAVRGWISDPNVMLIDFGWAEHGGQYYEDELCIRVYLIEKHRDRPALELAIANGRTRGRIPDSIGGFPVDRPESGRLKLQQWWGGGWGSPRRSRANPIQGGISVSNASVRGSGTLGGLVTDRETGDPMLLSNWHVLAGSWGIRPGWPIYQPGRGDGGTSADTVATYSHSAMSFHLDAAVAKLTGSRSLLNHPLDLEPVRGVGWAHPGMNVVKSGRTTGVTYGRITGVEGTFAGYFGGVYGYIRNVMTIVPRPGMEQVVSSGGDSGSLWLEEETMRAVGLHFVGNDDPEYAQAMDLQPILDALNVDLVF
jgi:endonuclease G